MASSILVVDDDPNLVRLMSKFLKLEGFAPVPAANGEEALAYLRGGGDASVILLDLRMPVMDGWTFRREQRGDPGLANIPIVILSGVAADTIQDLEAAASFSKPVSFPDVVVVVRRLCDARAASGH
jgi:CheY-like chemotaxis protein